MSDEVKSYMVLGPKGFPLDDRNSPFADERDNPMIFNSLRSAIKFSMWFEEHEKDCTEIVRLETIVPYDLSIYDRKPEPAG